MSDQVDWDLLISRKDYSALGSSVPRLAVAPDCPTWAHGGSWKSALVALSLEAWGFVVAARPEGCSRAPESHSKTSSLA